MHYVGVINYNWQKNVNFYSLFSYCLQRYISHVDTKQAVNMFITQLRIEIFSELPRSIMDISMITGFSTCIEQTFCYKARILLTMGILFYKYFINYHYFRHAAVESYSNYRHWSRTSDERCNNILHVLFAVKEQSTWRNWVILSIQS